MITYLPFSNYTQTAEVLDGELLDQQIDTALKVLKTLTGWYRRQQQRDYHHRPIVKMWKGFEHSLLKYLLALIEEKERRTRQPDSQRQVAETVWLMRDVKIKEDYLNPVWLGNPRFHLSHQSHLMGIKPDYYQFRVFTHIPLFWPNRK